MTFNQVSLPVIFSILAVLRTQSPEIQSPNDKLLPVFPESASLHEDKCVKQQSEISSLNTFVQAQKGQLENLVD